jgi:hypothetical protein
MNTKNDSSRQVYLPGGARVGLDLSDNEKLDALCTHHNLKPTELVRMLIRKEHKQVTEKEA